MSDDVTILVPLYPYFRAGEALLASAEEWLKQIAPEYDEVHSSSFAKPQFFDAGVNFETVSCPACGIEMGMDWWSDRMSEDYDGEGFRLDKYETPCCQSNLTLNELRYYFHQAFGVCAIQGRNLNVGELTHKEISEAERVLGAPLNVVYSHF